MNLLEKLELLRDSLPQLKENLGDRWEAFIQGLHAVRNKLEAGSRNEARVAIDSLFQQHEYLRGLLDGAEHMNRAIRTRGILSPSEQIAEYTPENLLAEHLIEKVDGILQMAKNLEQNKDDEYEQS